MIKLLKPNDDNVAVYAIAIAIAGFFAVVFLLPPNKANANPAIELAQSLPADIQGQARSWTTTCTTTATLIVPASEGGVSGIKAYSCQAPQSTETAGTVLIAVGDSGIADPAFATRNSPVYSGDTVREWGGAVRTEYCRADTGTVTIFCRGIK